MVPVSGKSAETAHYKLYGVLYHHGESAGGGRYSVDVLHPNGDSGGGAAWLHIDDEAVRAVRPEDVFGPPDNAGVEGGCAYMLFYCRAAR
jgi:ubiquitin carboxyl-terminal hydrolase 10